MVMRYSIERFGEVHNQAMGTPACLQRHGPIMCSLKKYVNEWWNDILGNHIDDSEANDFAAE